jgi:hypothetical protein
MDGTNISKRQRYTCILVFAYLHSTTTRCILSAFLTKSPDPGTTVMDQPNNDPPSRNIPRHPMSVTGNNTHGSKANYGTITGPVGNTNHFHYGTREDMKTSCLRALFASLGQPREPMQVRKFLRTCKGETTEGSLDWLLETDQYTEWLDGDPSLLWVFGGPGKGKSMIALHILDVLERTKIDSKTAASTPIWHFYDTQAGIAHVTSGNMVRGLIYQLLRTYDDLFEHILPEFEIQCEDLLHDSMFETPWSIFESMVHHPTLPTLDCILDGLDECEPTSLEWLLNRLDKPFRSWSEECPLRVRVVVLSRIKTPSCLSILFRHKHLFLGDHWKDWEGGVVRFVEHSFKRANIDMQLATRLDILHPLRKKETDLLKTLVDRAEGSYLWVNLNFDTLILLARLQSFFHDPVVLLPANRLEDIYISMIQKIAPESQALQQRAAVVLQWILAAARPPKVEEVAILSVLTQIEEYDGYVERDIHTWVAVCNHILEIRDDCVVLCHSSVREFFRQYWIHDNQRPPVALRICGIEHKIHETVLEGLYVAIQRARESENWIPVLNHYGEFQNAASHEADDKSASPSFIPPPEFATAFYCLQH